GTSGPAGSRAPCRAPPARRCAPATRTRRRTPAPAVPWWWCCCWSVSSIARLVLSPSPGRGSGVALAAARHGPLHGAADARRAPVCPRVPLTVAADAQVVVVVAAGGDRPCEGGAVG